MPHIKLNKPKGLDLKGDIQLNGSKSISNRVLLIKALCSKDFEIANLSNANDTVTLLRLQKIQKDSLLDAGDAGTTYRFMTAFLATQPQKNFLTGSKRMLERPIGPLVDALRTLGAQINYAGKEGYPPLQIAAPNFNQSIKPKLKIAASISSQYISALLLIAPSLPQGLILELEGEVVSEPYIEMTLELMTQFGIVYERIGNQIGINKQPYQATAFKIEADWSAASYFYALAALNQGAVDLSLSVLYNPSLQGDACIARIMYAFGVRTEFAENGRLRLYKEAEFKLPKSFSYDCTACPDLAQTLAVVGAGLGIEMELTGLQTLKIKETDRILALKTELEKLGAKVAVTDNSLRIEKGIILNQKPTEVIATYKDHRMAMAFAPLALLLGELKFDDAEVVNKSYPNFWKDLAVLGFGVK